MMYQVEKDGTICSRDGIPCAPRIFSDGRLNFSMDENGIADVNYFIKTGAGRSSWVFVRTLFDGLRWFVKKDLHTFKIGFDEVRICPYGLTASSVLKIGSCEYVFRQEILAVEESMLITVSCDQPFDGSVVLELNQTFENTIYNKGDCRYSLGNTQREWLDWEFVNGHMLAGGYRDVLSDGRISSCRIWLSSRDMCGYAHKNLKHILTCEMNSSCREAVFALNIRPEDENFDVEEFLGNIGRYKEEQRARYAEIRERMPVLKSKYSDVNDFFALAPLYHESMKIRDEKGGVRANNFIYWTWGWDGITATETYGYWNDVRFACDMLEYYCKARDPEKGIPHGLTYDNAYGGYMAPAAQGIYITLLHFCYEMTGDMNLLEKYYGMAKWIVNAFEDSLNRTTGFMEGISLVPDFPEFTMETGHDLSTFNNAIAYCALRSMEKLANVMRDSEMLKKTQGIFRLMEQNFDSCFYDEKTGFYASSADSITLEKRNVHILSSLKYENMFLKDLVVRRQEEAAEFIEKNLMGPFGLRDMALSDPAYDGDANQLHCWWPVHSEYFINTVNAADKGDLLDRFAGYISYWTSRLMCPEGISYYLENAGELDRWNCVPGVFQAYSIRGWYQAVIHGIVGVRFDQYGISIQPYDGDDIAIEKIAFKGKRLNISKQGKGRYVDSVQVDGKTIRNMNRISEKLLRDGSEITIYCTEKPYRAGHIISAQDLVVEELSENRYRLEGNATSRIYICGTGKETVYLDGKPVEYEAADGMLTVTFFAELGKTHILEMID